MFNHQISDLVSRIKNGSLAKKSIIVSPYSKIRESILLILKNEGYITSYTKLKNGSNVIENIEIHLKYHGYDPVVNDISVISKPGRKVYSKSSAIPVVKNGLGLVILSTHKGLLPDYEARSLGLGGELLLKVF